MGLWLLPLSVANVITILHGFHGFPWHFWGEETIFYNDATHWARSGLLCLQTHMQIQIHTCTKDTHSQCPVHSLQPTWKTSSPLTGTMAHIPPKCVWTWFAGTSSVLQSNSVCLTQLNRSSHCVSRYRITFLAHTSLWGHMYSLKIIPLFPLTAHLPILTMSLLRWNMK